MLLHFTPTISPEPGCVQSIALIESFLTMPPMMSVRKRGFYLGLACCILLAGCANFKKVDWSQRVGAYSLDDAIIEMGPPDSSAKLSDQSTVAQWMTQKGYARGSVVDNVSGTFVYMHDEPPAPSRFIRLTFGPDGKLRTWKEITK